MSLKMKYFVLKPKGYDVFARASRRAMEVYAFEIRETDPSFADELQEWVEREEKEGVRP